MPWDKGHQMLITVDGTQYEFDQDKFMLSEATAIEKVCGCTFQEWGERLQKGSMEAIQALVWIVQKRVNPELRFKDVDFPLASIEIVEDEPDPTDPPAVTTG